MTEIYNDNSTQNDVFHSSSTTTTRGGDDDHDDDESVNMNDRNFVVGDLVIVQKNKQGLIRYIGELHYDTNIWYGIELIGGAKGFHDGSFQGHKYFTCGHNQGVFVKKPQIVRRMGTNDYVQIHDSTHFKSSSTSSTKSRESKSPRPTSARSKSPRNSKIPKKLGPRDIGTIKGWKPSREVYDGERDKTTADNKSRRSSLTDLEHEMAENGGIQIEKKPGPREIGRVHSKNSDWTPIENADQIIEAHQQTQSFLAPSPSRRQRASSSMLMHVRKSSNSKSPKKSSAGNRRSTHDMFGRHGVANSMDNISARTGRGSNSTSTTPRKRKSAIKPLAITSNLSKLDGGNAIQRAKTPTPSRYGLKYRNQEALELNISTPNGSPNLTASLSSDRDSKRADAAKKRKKKKSSANKPRRLLSDDSVVSLSNSPPTTPTNTDIENDRSNEDELPSLPQNHSDNVHRRRKAKDEENEDSNLLRSNSTRTRSKTVKDDRSSRKKSDRKRKKKKSSNNQKAARSRARTVGGSSAKQRPQTARSRGASNAESPIPGYVKRSKSTERDLDDEVILHSLNAHTQSHTNLHPESQSQAPSTSRSQSKPPAKHMTSGSSSSSVGGFPDIFQFGPTNNSNNQRATANAKQKSHKNRHSNHTQAEHDSHAHRHHHHHHQQQQQQSGDVVIHLGQDDEVDGGQDDDSKNTKRHSNKSRGRQSKPQTVEHVRDKSSTQLNMSKTAMIGMYDADYADALDEDDPDQEAQEEGDVQNGGDRRSHRQHHKHGDGHGKKTKLQAPGHDDEDDDDILYAEISKEIRARQTSLNHLEQQLNELASSDFDVEFSQSLQQATSNQHQFKQQQEQVINEMEHHMKTLNVVKTPTGKDVIHRALWGDDDGDENDDDVLNIQITNQDLENAMHSFMD